MVRIRLASAILFISIFAPLSPAGAETEVELQLKQFHADPKLFMNKQPIKRDGLGQIRKQARPLFPVKAIRSREFVSMKNAFRKGEDLRGRPVGAKLCNRKGVCVKDVLNGRAGSPSRIEDFLDPRELKETSGRVVKRLDEMDKLQLREAKLADHPWSDSYWPIAQGILGNRYAEPRFMNLEGRPWKDYFTFINKDENSLLSIYRRGDAEEIDALSPSEKYDLLIGTLQQNGKPFKNGYMTPYMWQEGKMYWDQSGTVEPWMGICHGWAPAAYMLPRPTKSITMLAADGRTPLKFYPADLKALASYSWAKNSPPVRFHGGRCDDKDARRDPETGRILDEWCFDTNPGDWHTAIVNQIGIAKRSFVMDATFDYEVWNQPIFSYAYRLYNPETGKETRTLKEAAVTLPQYRRDKFKRFRSPEAKYIVGVAMDVTYVMETQPTHAETDSARNDIHETVTYIYDLEINARGEIIGGEWYSNIHPDFLWTPEINSHSRAPGDSQIPGNIDSAPLMDAPLPRFWADIAVANAARTGTPLGTLVEKMVVSSKTRRATAR